MREEVLSCETAETRSQEKNSIAALMTALLTACIAFQLNASMLGPVLATIARELQTDEVAVSLSQTVFFNSAAVFALFLPRFSDIAGRKKVLSWMLVIMTAGTVLAALAPNIGVLYVARAVQGISGAVVPMCMIMLRHEISNVKTLAAMMAIVAAVNGGVAGIDAIAGGFLAAHYGFRSVFWCIAIAGVISTVLILRFASESRPSAGVRMDWPGVIFLAVSLSAMLIALGKAAESSRSSLIIASGLAVFSILMFIGFWQVEKRKRHPLVSTVYLRRRSTWGLLLTTVLTMTGIFAVVNGLVLFLAQNTEVGFGLGADMAALVFLTPYALIGWLVGPLAGWLAPSVGYKKLLWFGLFASLVSLAMMLFLGLESLGWMVAAVLLIGISYAGIVNIMLNGLGVMLSPEDNPGFLPGMNSGAFHIGAGLSFVLLPTIQKITVEFGGSLMDGYFNGILAGLGITMLALLVSFLIPRPIEAEVER
ncbi:MAG: Major facilitator superfamily MFS_1 [Candidatus Tokpelaia hoelldobleri]|uniref:Major facilitator superfamily MFS_1 n=1 Tax=Candidatus Tokpelaia hoelldobleri TaxID=1902579 RepID=A0A1U9JUN9_9HYPH|nr:MAG: Major facilitator superfamily MFS_1 [Candidatus Tokpelaia hoelldoblerii]